MSRTPGKIRCVTPINGIAARGLSPELEGHTAVLMPGTGSDDDFITRAFGPALSDAGAALIAVRPEPNDLVNGYLRVLDRAARKGPIVVGGMSIGTAVALTWALQNPGATVAVLAAMPAWTGKPENSPAAVSARVTAESLRADGLAAVTAAMQASSPAWLGAELARSWAAQWPGLPNAMDAVSGFVNPTTDDIRGLAVPLAVAAATDDPIHPLAVGQDWASWAPRGALRTFTLDQLGADPSCLGQACVGALSDI
ncbi:Alpha/beta hydrolase family protein [Mycobacteroides abscessus subsp. bolletii]|nr:Alpha/beta hydrolase family protein [Mycobacteroides abscessus subsp. bolletii]